MTFFSISKESAGLIIIDVQQRLLEVMRRKQTVIDNILKLIHLSQLFSIPVITTEQYPKMLGTTLPEIKNRLKNFQPIKKMDFDCCSVETFKNSLESFNLKNIILSGVETHICILQTCLTLLERGYSVYVPQDAVDSRTEENWRVGLELMDRAGAVITSTETIIFQLLKRAGTKEFKDMLRMIK
jgi:nicotinamidase-related amidase